MIADEHAQRISKDLPPLSVSEVDELLRETPSWIRADNSIERTVEFESFREAVEFVNRVADIAEREDHHPDMCISYNKVRLVLSTHKIGGLSRNDFILAAKIDRLLG